jgi:hypothetical protein
VVHVAHAVSGNCFRRDGCKTLDRSRSTARACASAQVAGVTRPVSVAVSRRPPFVLAIEVALDLGIRGMPILHSVIAGASCAAR